MSTILIVVPVDEDVEAARLALSTAADRHRENRAVSHALSRAFCALADVNTAIDAAQQQERDDDA